METPSCLVPPVVPQLTGPLVIAYQLNWALYGVLSVQIYIYHLVSIKDHKFIKVMVYGLYLLETFQVILGAHDSFHLLALGWGNFEVLNSLLFAWLSIPILTGITSAIAQCFYTWRIYTLRRYKVLPLFLVMLSLMQCGAAIAQGLEALISQDVPNIIATFRTTIVWLGGTALCDILIAISMVYLLSTSRTGFKATDSILNKLIILVIETGTITAILAVIELTLFLTFKHNFYHLVPSLALSKLYTNSVLVLLNNRVRFGRQDRSADDSAASQSRDQKHTIQVGIQREVYSDNVAMVTFSSSQPAPLMKDSFSGLENESVGSRMC